MVSLIIIREFISEKVNPLFRLIPLVLDGLQITISNKSNVKTHINFIEN